MVENIRKRHPLLRILPQEVPDQVLGVGGDVRREVEPDVDDVPVGVLVGLRLEGGLSDQELVGEDAERPVVNSLAVGVTLETWDMSRWDKAEIILGLTSIISGGR